MNKILSSGLEDYIEEIYLAQVSNRDLKGAELARKLNVSRASVSEALSKLVTKKIINYSSYGYITLTNDGILLAKEVYKKHSTLEQFFEYVLGIEKKEASHNACEIEHIISENVLENMKKFTDFCKVNSKFIDKYREEYQLQCQKLAQSEDI